MASVQKYWCNHCYVLTYWGWTNTCLIPLSDLINLARVTYLYIYIYVYIYVYIYICIILNCVASAGLAWLFLHSHSSSTDVSFKLVLSLANRFLNGFSNDTNNYAHTAPSIAKAPTDKIPCKVSTRACSLAQREVKRNNILKSNR